MGTQRLGKGLQALIKTEKDGEKKIDTYKAFADACKNALKDGVVTRDETNLLDGLAESLGLSENERDVIIGDAKKKYKKKKKKSAKQEPLSDEARELKMLKIEKETLVKEIKIMRTEDEIMMAQIERLMKENKELKGETPEKEPETEEEVEDEKEETPKEEVPAEEEEPQEDLEPTEDAGEEVPAEEVSSEEEPPKEMPEEEPLPPEVVEVDEESRDDVVEEVEVIPPADEVAAPPPVVEEEEMAPPPAPAEEPKLKLEVKEKADKREYAAMIADKYADKKDDKKDQKTAGLDGKSIHALPEHTGREETFISKDDIYDQATRKQVECANCGEVFKVNVLKAGITIFKCEKCGQKSYFET